MSGTNTYKEQLQNIEMQVEIKYASSRKVAGDKLMIFTA